MTSPTPTTALYGLPLPADTIPLADLALIARQQSAATESALQRGGVVPPGAADLTAEATTRANADTALSTRVTALEPGGWVNLSLASAFVAYSPTGATPYGTPAYKVIGKKVWLRGWIYNAAAVAQSASILTAALPAAIRPTGAFATLWPITDTGAAKRCQLDTSGNLTTFLALAAGTYMNLDPVSWTLG